jgi:hypothetical protein
MTDLGFVIPPAEVPAPRNPGQATRRAGSKLRFALPPPGDPEAMLAPEQLPPDEWPHQPLEIFNGCRTGAFSADALSPLVTSLIDKRAAGVLATQIEVDERFAPAVEQGVLTRFLRGERIATVLLAVRRELLSSTTRSGLAHCSSDQLQEGSAAPRRARGLAHPQRSRRGSSPSSGVGSPCN